MQITFLRDVTEKTNRGNLNKAWYLINGEPHLVKGNTPGSFNSLGKVGYEPYSEVMASNIAQALNIPHVPYWLAEAKDFPDIKVSKIKHVSVCKNFHLQGYTAMPLRRYLMSKGVKSRADSWSYLQSSGLNLQPLYLLLLFDALTGNEDRHLNNIDMLLSPQGEVTFAPIFDNGASLLAWRYPFEFPLASVPYALDKARPFASTHKQQVALLPKGITPRLNLDVVKAQILASIEPMRPYLPKARFEAICRYVSWRVRYLQATKEG